MKARLAIILLIVACSSLNIIADEGAINSNDVNAWYDAALTHEYKATINDDRNEALEAIKSYKQILKFDPTNRSYLMSISALYATDLDDIHSSLIYLERVLETDPKDTEALMAKAFHLEELGRIN